MKRTGFLFEKITDIENIKTAIKNACKKKKNREPVKRILKDVDKYANQIQTMLINGTYKSSPYFIDKIIDNSSCKERVIYKPKFYPDQIVHWAVMQIVEPVIFRGMYYYCCGSIPGRGGAHAQKALKKWLKIDKKNTKYCLQIDVSKFYPSINQDVLKRMLRTKIKDEKCLGLLDMIIGSTESGLPIGNYTSQWFANFYLEGFDHFIKEQLKIKYAIRYMDDYIILGNNKRKLHKARKEIEIHLKNLSLKLKGNWQVYKVDSRPIDFLGYRFYRNHITLRRRNSLRIRRRARKIYKKKTLSYKDAAAMISYLGWIYHSNSHMYFNKYIKPYINIKKMKGAIRYESRKQHYASKDVCS